MTNGKYMQILLREVGYYYPYIEVIKERFLSNLVDALGYSTQTSCLLQILLKPPTELPNKHMLKHS